MDQRPEQVSRSRRRPIAAAAIDLPEAGGSANCRRLFVMPAGFSREKPGGSCSAAKSLVY
jgi:hypothetical protein